jgi:hypothetical protein
MQPYNEKGRKIRLAMMPISWAIAIAIATVYCLLVTISKIQGSSIKVLLQTETLWPLAIILPGLIFGKVIGLMAINLIAFLAPPLRRIFESEVSETGRHDFSKAMLDLSRISILFAVITFIGAIMFLQYN